MITRDITVAFIRDSSDSTFHSIPFKSKVEAQKAIDETAGFTTHETYSVVFPVTYDQKVMDRRAREWVQENFDAVPISSWTTQECWDFIEENHHAGVEGFLILAPLGA